ncbi:MAG: glycosyltransferase family 2 protein [Pseudomonadota bacterium]
MAEVSFLLPVYNGATYLAETLESLLAQTHSDFDILIINDGSTDDTLDVISKVDDRRIRVVTQDNQGLVKTLNRGLEMLDCTYVARIDADDICFPDRLMRQQDFLTFTRAEATSCRAININEAGDTIGDSNPGNDFRNCDPMFIPAREPYLPHPFLFARLVTLQEIGGFRQVHLAEDIDLCWRLFDYTRIAPQDAFLGKYRVHMNSVASNDLAGIRMQAVYSELAALNTYLRRNGLEEVFPPHSFADAKAFSSILDLVNSLKSLEEDLRAHLLAQSYWKYLDIWHWRKFPLEQGDIERALNAVRDITLSEANQDWHQTLLGWIKEDYPELV